MTTDADRVSQAFYAWERRGRGWSTYLAPVQLEPEFSPFILPNERTEVYDSGRVTISNTLRSWFSKPAQLEVPVNPEADAYLFEPEERLHILKLTMTSFEFDRQRERELLSLLLRSTLPVTLELVATSHGLHYQLAAYESDVARVRQLISVFFPQILLSDADPISLPLNEDVAIVDFGLRDEYMIPIRDLDPKSPDSLLAIIAASSALQAQEGILLQCTFIGLVNPWSRAMTEAVTLENGNSLLVDAPFFPDAVKRKTQSPLAAVSFRVVAQGSSRDRSYALCRACIDAFERGHSSEQNTLMPLSNEGITLESHIDCIIERTSLRTGMILSVGELQSIFHLPSNDPVLLSYLGSSALTRQVPDRYTHAGYHIGLNLHAGVRRDVRISDDDRLRHMHVIGVTGSGKSTLLINLISQDMAHGNGLCVCDPHGDLIDDILVRIPEERKNDVILIDPSNTEYAIGLNILLAHSEAERLFLCEEIISILRGQSLSWGDQMEQVLYHALSAFVERKDGGSLLDLRRFLTDTQFRSTITPTIADALTRHFWEHEYDSSHKRAVTPIVTRLDSFLRPKVIRAMMAQSKGIDFGSVMKDRKILLLRLAHGAIGEQNAHLLGSLLISKLYQSALARQSQAASSRTPFYLYIDEFHHFITKSLNGILSGSRKYGLGLTVAHQNLEQLSAHREVSAALLANAHIQICYRLGHQDAHVLERGFGHFAASDFVSLSVGSSIARIGGADDDFTMTGIPVPPHTIDIPALLSEFGRVSGQAYGESLEIVSDRMNQSFHREQPSKTPEPQKQDQHVETIDEAPVFTEVEKKQSIENAAEEFMHQERERKSIREHETIKNQVVLLAQNFGWKVQTEAPVHGGRIDVLLTSEERKVGIEISVTNTVTYELQNIKKCIESGCTSVLVVSQSTEKLSAIASTIEDSIRSSVIFLHSEELSNWFQSNTTINTQTTKIRGYRVKVSYSR